MPSTLQSRKVNITKIGVSPTLEKIAPFRMDAQPFDP